MWSFPGRDKRWWGVFCQMSPKVYSFPRLLRRLWEATSMLPDELFCTKCLLTDSWVPSFLSDLALRLDFFTHWLPVDTTGLPVDFFSLFFLLSHDTNFWPKLGSFSLWESQLQLKNQELIKQWRQVYSLAKEWGEVVGKSSWISFSSEERVRENVGWLRMTTAKHFYLNLWAIWTFEYYLQFDSQLLFEATYNHITSQRQTSPS
jgi:hypothetical protein